VLKIPITWYDGRKAVRIEKERTLGGDMNMY
jgi:hypothetical protein